MPLDRIAGTELVANFSARLTAQNFNPVVATPALVTKQAADQLEALGWKIQKL